MSPMRIYRAASRPIRLQFWMTVAALCVFSVAVVYGQTPAPAERSDAWLTPQNLITAAMLLYGIGMTVQNFRDQGERLKRLETKFERFSEETVPNGYVNKELFEARLGRRETDPTVRRQP